MMTFLKGSTSILSLPSCPCHLSEKRNRPELRLCFLTLLLLGLVIGCVMADDEVSYCLALLIRVEQGRTSVLVPTIKLIYRILISDYDYTLKNNPPPALAVLSSHAVKSIFAA